jgi:hypothetical protein
MTRTRTPAAGARAAAPAPPDASCASARLRGRAQPVLAGVLALVAAAVWLPHRRARRAGLALAFLPAAAYWVFGQAFGMPFTGTATDRNTGPLLALLAAAYWPAGGRAPETAPAATVRGPVTICQAGAASP